MKIYQIGGAVRDRLAGRTSADTDYVVVGATPAELTAAGFIPVGKSFPVFLHPDTKEEYALARKEIKTGPKHTDFKFQFSPDITLEEDLRRRDFTCNAIAFDPQSGEYIDPFGGRADIQKKLLRHIDSDHFPEDPLRVFRLCRFAATLDFAIDPETLALAKKTAANESLKHLTAERIWAEMQKALLSPLFYKFIETAILCDALPRFMPVGISDETLFRLKKSASCSASVKFALLTFGQKEKNLLKRTPKKLIKTANAFEKAFRLFRSETAESLLDAILTATFDLRTDISDFCDYCQIITADANTAALTAGCNVLRNIKADDIPDFQKLAGTPAMAEAYRAFRIGKLNDVPHF